MGTDLSQSRAPTARKCPGVCSAAYPRRGPADFERTIEAAQDRIAAEPNQASAYSDLASGPFYTDRFPAAEARFSAPPRANCKHPRFSLTDTTSQSLKGDREQMDRLQSGQGKPSARNTGSPTRRLSLLPVPAAFRAARRSSSRAVELALQEEDGSSRDHYIAARAVWEALCGNCRRSRTAALAALELSTGRDVEFAAGLCSGALGRLFPIRGALRRFGEAFPGRYVCEIYLRADPARVGRTAARAKFSGQCRAAGDHAYV